MKIKGYEDYSIYEDGRIVNSRGLVMKCQLDKDIKKIILIINKNEN